MKKLVASVFLLNLLFFSPSVIAQTSVDDSNGGNQGTDNSVPYVPTPIVLDNPLEVSSPQVLIARIINNVLGVVGTLALVMFIYGGLIWMTSSGSSEKVKQGRDIILWSVIGLVVIFSAYTIVRFVIQGIGA
ncbi:hypothetical protein CVU83_02070 [Candidatus Falkowbacteria bacterium HGW-Falkowbacteria-2]|uniref:Uncharacterized protein n=1 Tax=Candidatus Falkowbacteria bacterium HGW-Falkowbacteria-2 TaxID=2013769 RepID=A0A2N2E0H3_9BACT|nr:MAG: hypothetical protein CVU83_02070 [Candidatus Falkowbacteria bacterium HGW-Falkowbacteria-2]